MSVYAYYSVVYVSLSVGGVHFCGHRKSEIVRCPTLFFLAYCFDVNSLLEHKTHTFFLGWRPASIKDSGPLEAEGCMHRLHTWLFYADFGTRTLILGKVQ